MSDTWHLDELFVKIQGQQQYLWRAVDEDGDVITPAPKIMDRPKSFLFLTGMKMAAGFGG